MSPLEWVVHDPKYFEYFDECEQEQEPDGGEENEIVPPDFKPDPSTLVNHWTRPRASLFSVRGVDYLSQDGNFRTNNQEYKIPSLECVYECIGLNLFTSGCPMTPSMEKVAPLKEFMAKIENTDPAEGDAPQFLVCCWSFNNLFKTSYTCVVHLFKRKLPMNLAGDTPIERTFSRFMKADDETKRDKFKFEAAFRNCNPTLKASIDMLGGERPVIIGRKLTTTFFHYKEAKCLEICMDVGSSSTASMLYSLVMKTSGAIIMDYGFYVEGQEADELPEQLLGICRWNHCTLKNCTTPLDNGGNLIQTEEQQ